MNITAQIFGIFAIFFMFMSYLKTNKKEYLFMQIICNIFYITQYFLLSEFSAVGSCFITITKSFVFYKYEKNSQKIPISILIFIEILIAILGYFMYSSLFSLIPLFIASIYTYGSWQKNLKITYAIGTFVSIIWIFYNFMVGAYVSVIGSVFELVASIIGLYKLFHLTEI